MVGTELAGGSTEIISKPTTFIQKVAHSISLLAFYGQLVMSTVHRPGLRIRKGVSRSWLGNLLTVEVNWFTLCLFLAEGSRTLMQKLCCCSYQRTQAMKPRFDKKLWQISGGRALEGFVCCWMDLSAEIMGWRCELWLYHLQGRVELQSASCTSRKHLHLPANDQVGS